jgi:sigma-B regulation protein RsbU (phosphoserine phosphatase)
LVDARLLLAPVLLVYGNRIMGILILTTFQFGWQHRGEQTNFVLLSDPFRVNSEVLAKFLFLIAMRAILVNRFTRTRSQAERYATEFEAARNVQSLLIPATAPATPGFLAESVYLPASDVGGDFFQILPGGDGSLLVVVGDVSGKGLKAAMTVSTIVGALRDQRMCQPAEILTHLNRVLYGNVSGFVTCCAAFIAEDGAMFIANAGHLAPYLNGEEVAIDRKHTGFCLLSGALIGF